MRKSRPEVYRKKARLRSSLAAATSASPGVFSHAVAGQDCTMNVVESRCLSFPNKLTVSLPSSVLL